MRKVAKHRSKKEQRLYELKVIGASVFVGALFCWVVWWFSGLREFVVGGTVFGAFIGGGLAWTLFAFARACENRPNRNSWFN